MYVVGLKPVDDKWRKYKTIWDACEAAGVKLPKEVYEFFNGIYPEDDKGVSVNIPHAEYNNDCRTGIDVDISKLPKDVTIVRFYCV